MSYNLFAWSITDLWEWRLFSILLYCKQYCVCMLCICLLLRLSCYLLRLNSRSGNAGYAHFTSWYMWPSYPLERLSQFLVYTLSVLSLWCLLVKPFSFWFWVSHYVPLVPWGKATWMQKEAGWTNFFFFFLNWSMRSWAARKVLPLKALSDVAVEGPAVPLQFFLNQKGWTVKHEEACWKVTLMNVKHCSLQAADRSSPVDFTGFCMWIEAWSGRLPFWKMVTTIASMPYVCVQWEPCHAPSRGGV